MDIGFEDEIEHTVVDPSFIPTDLLDALDKSPALKVISQGQEGRSPAESHLAQAELQELDFYIKSGLHEDALALLDELRAKHGDQPALRERRDKIENA